MESDSGLQSPLLLDLRWQSDGIWHTLTARRGAGLTAVEGGGAGALLRLLAARDVPHQGTVTLDGRPLLSGRRAARHGPEIRPVAAVLGDERVHPWRTARADVAGSVRAFGVPRALARQRADQALGWVGAEHLARRRLALFSPAWRQRVVLARALAAVPGLLLLDRPCPSLSTRARADMFETIAYLAATWDAVVLFTVDDAYQAAQVLCPTIADG